MRDLFLCNKCTENKLLVLKACNKSTLFFVTKYKGEIKMKVTTSKISDSILLKKFSSFTADNCISLTNKDIFPLGAGKVEPLHIHKETKEKAVLANDISPRGTITATINVNTIYDVGTVTAGTTLLLNLTTKAYSKISLQSAFNANTNFTTTVFYVENGSAVIVTQSQNLLGDFDIDSFLPLGGIYYIQIDVTSGGGNMTLLATQLDKFSSLEPNDNLYQAISLTPAEKIEVSDFFDNANDWDFYAITSPAANSTAYVNFSFARDVLMTGSIKSPSINLLGFYYDTSGSIDWQLSESMSGAVIDHNIPLKNAGTYLIAIYHANQYQQGQLEEKYNFSVTFQRKVMGLTSQQNMAYISTYKGSRDEGTYDDSNFSNKSLFWIKGTAYHTLGTIANWPGGTGQFMARVRNEYDNFVYLTLVDVDENGNYSAIIPLPESKKRGGQASLYHGEYMEFNSVAFLGGESLGRADLYDPKVEIVGAAFHHKGGLYTKNIVIGVC